MVLPARLPLIISNSFWCWCLPKKPPLPAHLWTAAADQKKPGLSLKDVFLRGATICPGWWDTAGRTIITVSLAAKVVLVVVTRRTFLLPALFALPWPGPPPPHQQRTFFWILRKLDVFRLPAAAIVLVPAPMSHLTPILPVSSFLLNVFLIYLSGVEI